jgi:O-antigen/teichoic acid export membrane protein
VELGERGVELEIMSTGIVSRIETSKRLILINSASSVVTRLLSMSVLIWLQQYLLKRITPEEYSLLPVLYSVMMFAPLITTVLTGGLGRFISIAYAKGDDDEITRIVSTMFPILCVAGLVFLAAGWTFAWHIGSVLNIAPERLWDARIMVAMLMFSAAVRVPLAPFGLGFFVKQRFVMENLIAVGSEILRLTLLFMLLFGVSTRVLWVITASTAAELISLAITRTISIRLVPAQRFTRSHIHWPIAKDLTSFGGLSFVQGLFGTVLQAADPIILNKLASPIDVTCFYLGALPVRQFRALSGGIFGSIQPTIISMHATNHTDRLRFLFLRVGRLSLWCSLFVAAPFMVLGKDLIVLYVGDAYVQAGYVMLFLFAYFPTAYGNIMLSPIASAKAQLKPLVWRTAVENCMNLGLTLYLVGALKMGAKGSALSSLISVYVCHIFLWWPLAVRLLDLRIRQVFVQTIFPGLFPIFVGASFMLLCRSSFDPLRWMTLGVTAAIGGVAYAVSILMVMKKDDRADVAHVLISTLRVCSIKH